MSLPGQLGHAMATSLFFFFPHIWAFGGVQGLRFLAASSFSESFSSLLPCARWVLLGNLRQSHKSRAQALVIRSHNSVVVDIRRITCISPFPPNSHRFTFFTCFLPFKTARKEIYLNIFLLGRVFTRRYH